MSARAQRAPRQTPAPVSVTLAGWALLTMDGLRLALPQKDILTIELVSALQPARDGGSEIGWFAQDGRRWPIYCLDRRFAPAPALAATARVCVLFRSDERILGLAGTQVSLLAADEDLSVPPLPACLARPGSPLVGLALHRHAIVAVVHAAALGRHLSPLTAAQDG
jgi:hypothetical protein